MPRQKSKSDTTNEPILPELKILYIRMNSGEEIISIVEKPGSQLKLLMDDAKKDKDVKRRKAVMKALTEEKRELDSMPSDMLELHYPFRVSYVPTQKGVPALVLVPWISTTVTANQVFRISMDNVLTMVRPDFELASYYNSMVQRMILSLALRRTNESGIGFDPESEIGKKLKELKETMQHEKEEAEDDDIAEILAKSRRKPASTEDTDQQNTTPDTSALKKKETVH